MATFDYKFPSLYLSYKWKFPPDLCMVEIYWERDQSSRGSKQSSFKTRGLLIQAIFGRESQGPWQHLAKEQ